MSSRTLDPAGDYTVVRPEHIDEIIAAAAVAPLRRARLCLHTDHGDAIQEMIIAFHRDSYVQPHKHPGRCESIHVLRGEVEVVFFDDDGTITNRLSLSATGRGAPGIYRLRSPHWHTVIARTETAVIHEVTQGPFRAGEGPLAPWAPSPKDGAQVVSDYVRRLLAP